MRADKREYFGHVLHLVEDRGGLHGVQKPLRISPEPCDDVRVFQQEIAGPGKQMAQQPRFAGPARTGQDDRREVLDGPKHLSFQFSWDVTHQ